MQLDAKSTIGSSQRSMSRLTVLCCGIKDGDAVTVAIDPFTAFIPTLFEFLSLSDGVNVFQRLAPRSS
jgi:hypothetical protein